MAAVKSAPCVSFCHAATCLAEGVYIGGFPCKAFSWLCTSTGLLRDERARPFYKTLDVLMTVRPCFAILENVIGFQRVKDKVQAIFDREGLNSIYHCHWTIIDPAQLGCPCTRRRVYILCIRKDLATCNVQPDRLLSRMKTGCGNVDFDTLLFPKDHPALQHKAACR